MGILFAVEPENFNYQRACVAVPRLMLANVMLVKDGPQTFRSARESLSRFTQSDAFRVPIIDVSSVDAAPLKS
jgi:hypothetical protein